MKSCQNFHRWKFLTLTIHIFQVSYVLVLYTSRFYAYVFLFQVLTALLPSKSANFIWFIFIDKVDELIDKEELLQ